MDDEKSGANGRKIKEQTAVRLPRQIGFGGYCKAGFF